MARTEAFDRFPAEYDDWFTRHSDEYAAELETLKRLIPHKGEGLEIGIGSGKFAEPLGIQTGIDPSYHMIQRAKNFDFHLALGVAEALPFADAQFDFVLMVTTICFVDDIDQAFAEASRVLKPGGDAIIGFVDKDSALGRRYQEKKQSSRFYREADFYSSDEVCRHLETAGLIPRDVLQTLIPESSKKLIKAGFGEGSFVAIRAEKQ
jgi:ubiquinone/menaquinone biosynthesis C-methylase UbiE